MNNDNSGYGGESMDGDYEEQINWDQVGGVVPIGTYDLIVEAAEYKPTKQKKHMAAVRLRVEAAHETANAETSINKSIFENFVFTMAAGFRVKEFAAAAGIELPKTVNKLVIEEWCQMIVGVRVTANVGQRPDLDGNQRANIKKFLPLDLSAGATEDADAEPGSEIAGAGSEEAEVSAEAAVEPEPEPEVAAAEPEPEPEVAAAAVEPEPPPPPPPAKATATKSIREAVATAAANKKSTSTAAPPAKAATNGVNGHANGKPKATATKDARAQPRR